jgi:hypothetical protein
MFKSKMKSLRGPDLILVFGLGLIALIHASFEKTLYYWDFGDYQRNLIQLHLAAKDGFTPFISQLWEFQNSEYPVSWAGPFALFPLISFTNRALFAILLSTVGIYLWAKSTQILATKIFKKEELSKLALILLCCSAGPWMLALRGWPDVIACGLIWLGFAKSYETKRADEFVWGMLLILLGIVMRKTTLDLGFCLGLISSLSVINLEFLQNARITFSNNKKTLITQLTLIVVWIIINPGFVESVFIRNNRDFYKPFQVTFKEYVNNLVAMNGSIYLVLSLVAVWHLIKFGIKQGRFGLIGLGLLPFFFTAIWMTLFKQATDHHMVQWVPIFATLGMIFILNFFLNKKNWVYLQKASVLSGFFSLGIVLIMPQTPFANPSNAFARPFAHSIAPLQRPDIVSLTTVKKDIYPLILSGASIVSLNESHEFNQGNLKAMFQDSNFKKISLLPIGTMDYRDDPGFRNFFDADYLLVPDPFIPLIPQYQNTLMAFNSEFQSTVEKSNYWQKKATYKIGDINSSSTWWSNDYAKKLTEISLYKRVTEIPRDYRQNFVRNVYANTERLGTRMASLQLVSGPATSFGASLANNGVVTLELKRSTVPAMIYLGVRKVNFDSNCKFFAHFDNGSSVSISSGKSKLEVTGTKASFFTINLSKNNSKTCRISIYPSNT